MIYELLFSIAASVSVFLAVVGFIQLRQRAGMSQRLNISLGGLDRPARLYDQEMAQPFTQRVLIPALRRVGHVMMRFWPEQRLKVVRQRLLLAGSPGGLRAIDFVVLRFGAALAFFGVGAFYVWAKATPGFIDYILVGVLALCGYYLPNAWLSRRTRERQVSIVRSMPDAIDMLVITTEAGLSFESGLQEIMTKWDNELSRELGRTLRDIGMGLSRRQALLDLAARTGVPDVQSFVTALNQAEELGVSIGRVLRTQSEDMRVKRRQRAYELANQAPVKIMFPLVFLIFPSIFAVLLGPALPQLLAFGA